jgi:ATP-dependent protease HslVU (ClpYQ) peptidase subunit
MKKVVQLYEAFVSSGLVIFKAELRPLSTKLQKNRSAGGAPATADSFTLYFTIKSKKKQERTALYRNFSAKGRFPDVICGMNLSVIVSRCQLPW